MASKYLRHVSKDATIYGGNGAGAYFLDSSCSFLVSFSSS